MDPEWRCCPFPIEHGDIPACHVIKYQTVIGLLYYQPKQCILIWEVHQNSPTCVLFDTPNNGSHFMTYTVFSTGVNKNPKHWTYVGSVHVRSDPIESKLTEVQTMCLLSYQGLFQWTWLWVAWWRCFFPGWNFLALSCTIRMIGFIGWTNQPVWEMVRFAPVTLDQCAAEFLCFFFAGGSNFLCFFPEGLKLGLNRKRVDTKITARKKAEVRING